MRKLLLATMLLTATATFAQEKIHWMTIEQAEAANKVEPKKLLIDVYTSWCGWCKKMDQTTFQNPVIVKYINENYYPVKFNAEQKDTIHFLGETFKYVKQGRTGYNELAATLLDGKLSYPNIVYLNEKLQMIQPIPGYMDVEKFEKIIKFFGGDYYKTVSYEEFTKDFVSEL